MAVREVLRSPVTPWTRGIRLGNYARIRELIIDNLEKAFSGGISPSQALDAAVYAGNLLLEDYQKKEGEN